MKKMIFKRGNVLIATPKIKKRSFEIKSIDDKKSCFVFDTQFDAINKAKTMIQNSFTDVNACILYGSCARSNCKYESDVDLMLVLNKVDQNTKIIYRKLLSELDMDSITKVDLHICEIDNFNYTKSTYFDAIKREGIVLW